LRTKFSVKTNKVDRAEASKTQNKQPRAAMTILGKLRGEITDQEKVPLPMNLNDEALMHHGSLIAVSLHLHPRDVALFCAIVAGCPCGCP